MKILKIFGHPQISFYETKYITADLATEIIENGGDIRIFKNGNLLVIVRKNEE